MDANAIALLDIFEKKMRLEVPMFQRQYVWKQEHQWAPLWEDISRKFVEFIEGRTDAPVHFLGAMVLDQRQTQTGRVERRSVIDGQQRLTTLQIFLASFRDFCRCEGLSDFADECEKYTVNTGRMAEPEVEKYKLWPTLSDRQQFIDVVDAGSRDALESKGPANTRGPTLAQSRRYAVAVGGSQMCGSSWSMSRALWVGSRVSTSFRYA